jgi:hypothetical protein
VTDRAQLQEHLLACPACGLILEVRQGFKLGNRVVAPTVFRLPAEEHAARCDPRSRVEGVWRVRVEPEQLSLDDEERLAA